MNKQKENSLNVKIVKMIVNRFKHIDLGCNIKQSNRSIDIFIYLTIKILHTQCTIHVFLVLQALQNKKN